MVAITGVHRTESVLLLVKCLMMSSQLCIHTLQTLCNYETRWTEHHCYVELPNAFFFTTFYSKMHQFNMTQAWWHKHDETPHSFCKSNFPTVHLLSSCLYVYLLNICQAPNDSTQSLIGKCIILLIVSTFASQKVQNGLINFLHPGT